MSKNWIGGIKNPLQTRAIFGLSLSLAFHSTAQKDIKKTRQLTAHLATAFSLMDVIVKERGSGIGNPEQRGAPRQNPLLYTKEVSLSEWARGVVVSIYYMSI